MSSATLGKLAEHRKTPVALPEPASVTAHCHTIGLHTTRPWQGMCEAIAETQAGHGSIFVDPKFKHLGLLLPRVHAPTRATVGLIAGWQREDRPFKVYRVDVAADLILRARDARRWLYHNKCHMRLKNQPRGPGRDYGNGFYAVGRRGAPSELYTYIRPTTAFAGSDNMHPYEISQDVPMNRALLDRQPTDLQATSYTSDDDHGCILRIEFRLQKSRRVRSQIGDIENLFSLNPSELFNDNLFCLYPRPTWRKANANATSGPIALAGRFMLQKLMPRKLLVPCPVSSLLPIPSQLTFPG